MVVPTPPVRATRGYQGSQPENDFESQIVVKIISSIFNITCSTDRYIITGKEQFVNP